MSGTYSERHLDPREALAYRDKFKRTTLRRLSHHRERAILRAAVAAACDLLPAVLPHESSPRLLDLPCGAGRFAPMLRGFAKSYLGADHSPHMIELCRTELGRAGVAAESEFAECDAREMPFEDDAFDLACCIRLVHHFRDRADRTRILAEFRRVTRGPLVLTFLDAESPKQWIHIRKLALANRTSRRALVSREELAGEAADSGFALRRTWSLSGLFSGQSVALLT